MSKSASMKFSVATLIFPVCAFVLIGCSDPKDANKENFSKAIQEYLNQEKACMGIQGRYLDTGLYNEFTDLNEFVKIGLLKKEALKPKSSMTRNVDPRVLYSLTEQGKEISRKKEGFLGDTVLLCYGEKVITGVTNFTPPATMGGYTISRVKYTYKVTGIDDWVKNELLMKQYKNLRGELNSANTPLEEEATLMLTNAGWVHETLQK
ncbi:hypothetical protein MNBD_GAMMA14-144 [hydrothermal vent metagenome]|uniref:Lipoprotein n=1 Tax=hydrothermal vent metagenome TaxID=652676 RepID=A0A3B0Z002_9ZZZZ